MVLHQINPLFLLRDNPEKNTFADIEIPSASYSRYVTNGFCIVEPVRDASVQSLIAK